MLFRTFIRALVYFSFGSWFGVAVHASRPADYWQQEVNYRIDATLQSDLRHISGRIDIEYINHSPDTLDRLYLKAFPNALQRDSYADKKRQTYNDWSLHNLRPEQQGRLELLENPEAPPSYRSIDIDNTIVTVYLATALYPGDTVSLSFDFRTTLPTIGRMRMGLIRGVVKAAYWYPQVCVYDHKLGWVNAQYLGWGECYGDYGRFDVTITAPEDQIVAASGKLINEDEVMPPQLRQQLDISNYLKPRRDWPQLNLDTTRTKTWHFIAERVNDFAWTSSNQFCIDSGDTLGVKVVAYPLRYKAASWKHAVRYGKEAIATYSELYHPYAWPVIRIMDAFDGMEFPMLTNCGAGDPSPRFALLLYHEIGHQWFMGQVGSNQVDRPFLDEGFTTHAEHVIMEKYFGRHDNWNHYTTWYQKTFAPPIEDRNQRGFRPFLLLMKQGLDRPGLFTYDAGEEYVPYRTSAYYKSASMHYSLRSILGDSAYFAAMRHYCDDWFFAHPYEEDFTRAMEEATGLELDAYLNQWYFSRERIDYAYAGKKTVRTSEGQYRHTITLKRYGGFVAPVDVAVIWPQGDTSWYTIPPEGMAFAKPGYRAMPVWPEFRQGSRKYQFTIKARRQIRKVVVDPHNLLADINRLNNSSGLLPPLEVRFDNLKYDRTPVNRYALRLRPDLWYDEPNGVLFGLHAHGSYLETEHRFSVDAAIGTESWRPYVDASYSTPFVPFGALSSVGYRLLRADYRTYFVNSWEKSFRKWVSRPDREEFTLKLGLLDLDAEQANRYQPIPSKQQAYLPDPTWDARTTWFADLSTLSLHTFRYGNYWLSSSNLLGIYETDGDHGGFSVNEARAGLTLLAGKTTWRGKLFALTTTGRPPAQYLSHLSRVTSVRRFTEARLFRSPGSFPTAWEDDFYVSTERVRGYQDRALWVTDAYGWSLEMTPPDLLPFRRLSFVPVLGQLLRGLNNAVFVEGSWVTMDGRESEYRLPIVNNETDPFGKTLKLYVSAGVSLTTPAIYHGNRLRFDFPVYLNRPASGDNEFDFRFSVSWLLADGR